MDADRRNSGFCQPRNHRESNLFVLQKWVLLQLKPAFYSFTSDFQREFLISVSVVYARYTLTPILHLKNRSSQKRFIRHLLWYHTKGRWKWREFSLKAFKATGERRISNPTISVIHAWYLQKWTYTQQKARCDLMYRLRHNWVLTGQSQRKPESRCLKPSPHGAESAVICRRYCTYVTSSNNQAAAPTDAWLFGEDLARSWKPAEARGETNMSDERRRGQTDHWMDGRMDED